MVCAMKNLTKMNLDKMVIEKALGIKKLQAQIFRMVGPFVLKSWFHAEAQTVSH